MNKNQGNFPCVCGHLKKDHKQGNIYYKSICIAKNKHNGIYFADNCTEFKPDNLLYLEEVASDVSRQKDKS